MEPSSDSDYTLISTGHSAPITERFSFRAITDLVYKITPQAELVMTLHFPFDWKKNDRRAAVLFFFGGGWSSGTRYQFERQCAFLAARGMVAASADYRIKSSHGTDVAECVEDTRSAIRWLRANAEMLGVDPNRVAAGGGSAGGHLAAALATAPGIDSPMEDRSIPVRPDALVLYNPALGAFNRPEIGNYQIADELFPRVSVLENLNGELPPTWVWFGERDRFYALARPFLEYAERSAARYVLELASGADHGYFNDYAEYFTPAIASMDRFLTEIGFAGSAT